ncbi:DNA/RNA polymerase, partial [Tilletiaria anomala UBC 951]
DQITGSVGAKADRQDAYLDSEAYEAVAFGDFATYMRHKRQKLKVQESALLQEERMLLKYQQRALGSLAVKDAEESSSKPLADIAEIDKEHPQVFKGCCIYINGLTQPPYLELRRLIVLHGGDFMAYLDTKGTVTHIIASSLTPKKRIEFKDYKVVNESWILDSIREGRRMDWRRYRVEAENGPELERWNKMKVQSKEAAKNQGSQWSSKLTRINVTSLRAHKELASQDGNRLEAPVTPEKGKADPFLPPTALADKNNTSPWGKSTAQKKLLDIWARGAESSSKVGIMISAAAQTPVGTTQPYTVIGTNPSLPVAAARLVVDNAPYTSHPSNGHAARLLASPSWRERNTASSGDFLSGYFEKSRLHHLSSWKMQMKDMVEDALRESGRVMGSPELPKGVKRVIMHIDFDSFFVSVGLRDRPELNAKPVVVCHRQGQMYSTDGDQRTVPVQRTSTSEIASCNYVARSFGIRNGMSLGQAHTKCAEVHSIPYEFDAYNNISIQLYTILLAHSDAIEAVSVDEALIDVSFLLEELRNGNVRQEAQLLEKYRHYVSSQGDSWTGERQLAEALRDEIRSKTRTEASIGIGSNVLLARLATRKAKPGGSFHLLDKDVPTFLADLDIDDLHGIGWSAREACKKEFGCVTISELLFKAKESDFRRVFGREKGAQYWNKLHGKERDKLEGARVRRSIGAAVNYAMRFQDQGEAETFVQNLAAEVAGRMEKAKLAGRKVQVAVMVRAKDAPVEAPKFLGHGVCQTYNKSAKLSSSTHDPAQIKRTAWSLIKALNADPRELRGIGISLQDLTSTTPGAHLPLVPKDGQSLLMFGSDKRDATWPVLQGEKLPSKSNTSDGAAQAPKTVRFDEGAWDEAETPLLPGPSLVSFQRRSLSPAPGAEEELAQLEVEYDRMEPQSRAPVDAQYMVPTQMDQDVLAEMPETMRAQLKAAMDKKAADKASDAERRRDQPPVRSDVTLTASQIDSATLDELPESLRKEILRELAEVSRNNLGPRPPMLPLRVATKSPRKKPAAASPNKTLPKHKLVSPLKKNQPVIDQVTLWIMNPDMLKDTDLRELGVDAEYYRALPAHLQRELIREQTAAVQKSKKARAKPASKTSDMTRAEKRAAETQR